jgi:hypothetical protein
MGDDCPRMSSASLGRSGMLTCHNLLVRHGADEAEDM